MGGIKLTNLVKVYTLLLLSEGPKHGYELMRKVRERLRERVGPGTIYPLLSRLKKAGYLDVKKSGGREKKTYALNAKGRVFVKRMVDRFGSLFEIAIEPKLTVCSHCGCRVYEGGHQETVSGRKMMFCCCHCAESFKSQRG